MTTNSMHACKTGSVKIDTHPSGMQIDSGVPEKVLLLSRDEQNMMVVSYADLKACAEGAFAQVNEAAARSAQ